MLIGNQYSDNKLYRGIKHYDHLPIMSEDIHEYADTVFMKNAYIMNNLLGSGLMNTPGLVLSSKGIKLQEPAVILIDGDISLIQADDSSVFISTEAIRGKGYSDGTVCIVGWYQSILASSTMKNYGGLYNSDLQNDLLDNKFKTQLTSRYQFRWIPVLVSKDSLGNLLEVPLPSLTESGDIDQENHYSVVANVYSNEVLKARTPTNFPAEGDTLYVIPILDYHYNASTRLVESVHVHPAIAARGEDRQEFIKSDTEPVGEYVDGTVWYSPITREFKTYITGEGFVDSAATMGFLQYQSVSHVGSNPPAAGGRYPVNLSIEEGDILQVNYEGLVLVEGEHYTVDYQNDSIDLAPDFIVSTGDMITFKVTRIVEANDVTNITSTFTTHMTQRGSNSIEAHVRLSDDIDSSLDASDGVAATPKAVADSRLISDGSGVKYKFGVDNGMLYIEEV